jgi:hypothetical protein
MNQPDKKKRKFTYFEHKKVFNTLERIAKDETSMRGRIVTVPELIRNLTKALANEYRSKRGKRLINYDTSAGKFAPSKVGSPTDAFVYIDGRMEVFDKTGKKMNEWKNVTQLPELLRLYPKCKVQFRPSQGDDEMI